MTKQEKALLIAEELQKRYPETKTFLHFSTDWQLLFAIILSAQATDISVNQATEILFLRLPELKDYNEDKIPFMEYAKNSLELKKKYTNIEIDQISSEKVSKAVFEFADVLKKDFPQDALINFYNNF